MRRVHRGTTQTGPVRTAGRCGRVPSGSRDDADAPHPDRGTTRTGHGGGPRDIAAGPPRNKAEGPLADHGEMLTNPSERGTMRRVPTGPPDDEKGSLPDSWTTRQVHRGTTRRVHRATTLTGPVRTAGRRGGSTAVLRVPSGRPDDTAGPPREDRFSLSPEPKEKTQAEAETLLTPNAVQRAGCTAGRWRRCGAGTQRHRDSRGTELALRGSPAKVALSASARIRALSRIPIGRRLARAAIPPVIFKWSP